jgi:hypothetical protein
MIHRLLISMALTTVAVVTLSAQETADKRRVASLVPIETPLGLTSISNAEGDGRDAQVFTAWRDNGNAWGYHVYIVTMPERSSNGVARTPWNVVGIDGEPTIRDSPHTGEDAIISVRFARGTLDGKSATLLITAERRGWTTVPDPAVTLIRVYTLRNSHDRGDFVGTTPDAFEPVISFTTTQLYVDADSALKAELGLPLPSGK